MAASARVELARRAAALRSGGMLQREIADALGISRTYAAELLDDPDGSKARARKERYRGTCLDCGAPTSGGDGRAAAPKRCAACSARKQHDERYWTRERVLEAIKRFAEEHGRPPVATEWLYGTHGINGDGYPNVPIVLRECGSWADAIETAGFPRPFVGHNHRGAKSGYRVSTDELIQRIRDRAEVVRLAPTTYGNSTYNQLRERGISWAEACELADVTPRRRSR